MNEMLLGFVIDHKILLSSIIVLIAALFLIFVKKRSIRIYALIITVTAILMIGFFPLGNEAFPAIVAKQMYKDPEEAVKQRDIILQRKAGAFAQYFTVEESTDQFTYYDCVFEYRGVRTDITYTFKLDNGVITVYDNTHGANLLITKNKIDSFWKNHSDENIRSLQEKQEEDFREKWNPRNSILELRQTILFSSVESMFYSCIFYSAKTESGAYFANELRTPLE